MGSKIWAVALLVAISLASPHVLPRQDQVPSDIQALIDSTTKYDPDTRLEEITEWLASGYSPCCISIFPRIGTLYPS